MQSSARQLRSRGDETDLTASESEEDGHGGKGCCACGDEDHDTKVAFVKDSHDPSYVSHRCTDILCLAVFLAAVCGLAYIGVFYSSVHGDIRRLYHGYDFLGDLCGIDNTGPNSTGLDKTKTPVLFWCTHKSGIGLDFDHPVCRESCPSNGSYFSCYDSAVPGAWKDKTDPVKDLAPGSFARETVYHFRYVKDYATKPLLGVYCYPTESKYASVLMDHLKQNKATEMLIKAASIQNAMPILGASALMAIILGFLYLFLLEKCAHCLVYTSIFILCTVPPVFGGVFTYASFQEGGLDGLPSTGDRTWDMYIGLGCIALGGVMVCISCCACAAIETAIRVVQAASECLLSMPTLFVEPVLTQLLRLSILSGLLYGLGQLLSCGEMSTMTLEQYAALAGSSVSGVFRKFTYSEDEIYYILYYLFMIVWAMCLCTAAAQFAIAYAVSCWYFTPVVEGSREGVPCCPIVWGYIIGWTLHLGSLAFGSFFIAALIAVRVVLAYIARQARAEDNHAAAAIAKCLSCCVACFQRCLEFLNKNAYMDIALNSTNFCFAAKNAFMIIIKEFPEMAILNGACWVFQVMGVGSVTTLGCALVYVVIKNVAQFNDPSSAAYIADPLLVMAIAGLVCFSVSYAFMMVYDVVADTILYCKATEEIRRKRGLIGPDEQYAPDGLNELISK